MGEWKEYKLGDIISLGNGKVRPKDIGDIPVYGGNGILGYCNSSNYDGEIIVIGRVGAYCGSVYYENRPIWISDNALAAKSKKEYSTKFIYYLLKKLRLNDYAEGSSHPLITQNLLNAIDVLFIDDIEEQKSIASILSSLDDKIDLLHQENKTLEAMVETLFRKWFIEEVRHEVSLGDVVETTSGGTPSRKCEEYYQNGIIDWVKSKELNRSYLLKTEEKITVEAVGNSSAKFLPANSVLIAMYGATVGEYAIIAKEMTCNQAVCALKPNDNYPYTYLYLWAKFMQDEFLNLACGAAQQNISQVLIKQQQVCSDVDAVKQFHSIVEPFFEKLKQNEMQLSSLEEMKNVILPKLMNNELNINEL